MRDAWPIFAFFAVVAVLCGGVYWMSRAPEREGWRICEDAIMKTLKAPATYKRVEGPETYAVSDDMFRITYDAQNGFGVPLRSTGSCMIMEDGRVSWVEFNDYMK